MMTNEDAPNYRLVRFDISQPKQWNEVVPEGKNPMSNAQVIGGKWILTYGQDASDHAYIYSMEGKKGALP